MGTPPERQPPLDTGPRTVRYPIPTIVYSLRFHARCNDDYGPGRRHRNRRRAPARGRDGRDADRDRVRARRGRDRSGRRRAGVRREGTAAVRSADRPRPQRGPADRVASLVTLDGFSPAGRAVLERLWTAFWPGPLTLVLPRSAGSPGPGHRRPRRPSGSGCPVTRSPTRCITAVGRRSSLRARTGSGGSARRRRRWSSRSSGIGSATCSTAAVHRRRRVDGGRGRSRRGAAAPAARRRPGRGAGRGRGRPVARRRNGDRGPGQTPSHYAPRAPLVLLPATVGNRSRDPAALGAPVGLLVARGPSSRRWSASASSGCRWSTPRPCPPPATRAKPPVGCSRPCAPSTTAAPTLLVAEPWADRDRSRARHRRPARSRSGTRVRGRLRGMWARHRLGEPPVRSAATPLQGCLWISAADHVRRTDQDGDGAPTARGLRRRGPGRFPGAPEIPCDSIDNDCNPNSADGPGGDDADSATEVNAVDLRQHRRGARGRRSGDTLTDLRRTVATAAGDHGPGPDGQRDRRSREARSSTRTASTGRRSRSSRPDVTLQNLTVENGFGLEPRGLRHLGRRGVRLRGPRQADAEPGGRREQPRGRRRRASSGRQSGELVIVDSDHPRATTATSNGGGVYVPRSATFTDTTVIENDGRRARAGASGSGRGASARRCAGRPRSA